MNKKSEVLIALAEFFGDEMTEVRLKMYLKVLKVLSLDELKLGCQKLMQEQTTRKMPLPAELIRAVNPHLTDKEKAILSLDRIQKAIVRFGYNQGEEAHQALNEPEWAYVKSRGGWSRLCSDRVNNLGNSSTFAQARQSLETLYKTGVREDLLEGTKVKQLLGGTS